SCAAFGARPAGRAGPPSSRRPPRRIFSCVSSDVQPAEPLHRFARPEVVQLEQLAYLDLTVLAVEGGIGEAAGPLHSFFLGLHLDHRVSGDQLLRLREGTVDQGAFRAGVLDAPALRAGL